MGVVETEKRTLFSECRPEEYESINLENSEAGSELVNYVSPNQRDRVESVHLQPEGYLKKTCHANRTCMKKTQPASCLEDLGEKQLTSMSWSAQLKELDSALTA